MTVAVKHIDDTPFEFDKKNFEQAKVIIARYPEGKQQSALLPLLMLAQKQNANYLSKPAMDYIAAMLSMAPVRVYEVATFYTMYNHEPVGKYMIEVCTTTPCWLRGSDAIVKACKTRLGIGMNQTTPDGMFTLREAECLGSCVSAPMCQIGDHYYEDLTEETMVKLIDDLVAGTAPKPNSQSGRQSTEPASGRTSLKEGA